MLHIPAFMTYHGYTPKDFVVKFVVIPPWFVQQQYLWNIVMQPTFGCCNVWANVRSGCSPLGENSLWNRTISLTQVSKCDTGIRVKSYFSVFSVMERSGGFPIICLLHRVTNILYCELHDHGFIYDVWFINLNYAYIAYQFIDSWRFFSYKYVMRVIKSIAFAWLGQLLLSLDSSCPFLKECCGGSRARCSWAHGPVTSKDCGLTGEEPRDSRRLSLTTVRARRDREHLNVTTVESWKPPDLLQDKWVVWASRSSVHRVWYDLCASGAVLTLPGPADLCRVFGSTATVDCLWDWPCGGHVSLQGCLPVNFRHWLNHDT